MYQRNKIFCVFCFFLFVSIFNSEAQSGISGLRSFNELFGGLGEKRKNEVFSEAGYLDSYWKERGEFFAFVPSPGSEIDLLGPVMEKNPTLLAEAMIVLPYSGKIWDKLDVYNALGKIRNLKDLQYHSFTRNEFVSLFEDATRLESAKKTTAIPDPGMARSVPSSETVYMRLKDNNFGNCYYRGVLTNSRYGLTYSVVNFKNISYMLFNITKEENLKLLLYTEPIEEGMLIYSVAGAVPTDFASSRINPSAIEKRLGVFMEWIIKGLKEN